MKSRAGFFFALLLGVGVVAGCSSEPKEEFGDKKEDWNKTAPPAGWKGPGQGDTAASGPIGGPPAGK